LNVNKSLEDVKNAQRQIDEATQNAQKQIDEATHRLDQVNHSVVHYLLGRWVQDFDQLMIYLSPQMPEEDSSRAKATLTANLSLIVDLTHVFEAQQNSVSPRDTTEDDERALHELVSEQGQLSRTLERAGRRPDEPRDRAVERHAWGGGAPIQPQHLFRDDEPAIKLLAEAYTAVLSTIDMIEAPYNRKDPGYASILNKAQDSWTKFASTADGKNDD